jgi:hypothetical protein
MRAFRRRWALSAVVVALLGGVAVACDGVSSSSKSETLHRPLDLPKLKPGEACPTAGQDAGPVYPVGFKRGAEAALSFLYPPPKDSSFAGSGWGGQKVLWAASPDYRAPVLIRGRRLDAPGEVRFSHPGGRALKELRLPATATWATGPGLAKGWRYFPTYTRLRKTGCYAYQVDGTSFSRTLVFKAEAWLPIALELGRPGCRPPSPVGAFGRDLPEAAGRLSRASLWALFFPPPGTKLARRHRAVFTNLAGRSMRIVFRATGSGKAAFAATAPDGSRHDPIERPTRQEDSSWDRPGDEWATVFHFGERGCWKIHVSRRGGTGEVWLIVR